MSETARDIFKLNQRVRMTQAAEDHYIGKCGTKGIVRGFGRPKPEGADWTVSVQKLNRKSVVKYHMKFWEPVK